MLDGNTKTDLVTILIVVVLIVCGFAYYYGDRSTKKWHPGGVSIVDNSVDVLPLPKPKDYEDARKLARLSHYPILLVFRTRNCIYCDKLDNETLSNGLVKREIDTRWLFLEVKHEENRLLCRKFGVHVYPTYAAVYITKDDKAVVVEKDAGFLPADEFLGWLKDNYKKCVRED